MKIYRLSLTILVIFTVGCLFGVQGQSGTVPNTISSNTPLQYTQAMPGVSISVPAQTVAPGKIPQLVKAWNKMGNTLKKSGKYDEAIQAYDKAIQLDPTNANVWNNKGTVLNKQGRYDEAILAFNQTVSINPRLASAWNNIGNVLKKQGKYDEAILAFNQASRINPRLASARKNKNNALKLLGRTK